MDRRGIRCVPVEDRLLHFFQLLSAFEPCHLSSNSIFPYSRLKVSEPLQLLPLVEIGAATLTLYCRHIA